MLKGIDVGTLTDSYDLSELRLPTDYSGFFLRILLNPEDGGGMCLRNGRLFPKYVEVYLRRPKSPKRSSSRKFL
jgi:hypothetical protein